MSLSLKLLRSLAKTLIALSLTSSLLVPTGASAEVRIEQGKIVMAESDFRKLMSDLEAAEAERDALKFALEVERQHQDDYMVQVQELRRYFDDEREAWKASVKSEKGKQPIWGLIGLGIGLAAR